jgi:hypothetical protein
VSLQTLTVLVLLALSAAVLVALVLMRGAYRLEVEPATAVVVKNLWTTGLRAEFQGSTTLFPGMEKVVRTVSLQDEPSDPTSQEVTTSDRIRLRVDYVVQEMRVLADPRNGLAEAEMEENVINAATKIDYDKRREYILVRIASALLDVFFKRPLSYVYEVPPQGQEGPRQVKHDKAKELEDEVNSILYDQVTVPWGFKVRIQIENLELPAALMTTAEERETAETRGQAIAKLADTADVNPNLVLIGTFLADLVGAIVGAIKGNKDKEGGK